MSVAKAFTGQEGKYVPIEQTVESFRQIIDGEPTIFGGRFLMVGDINEAREKRRPFSYTVRVKGVTAVSTFKLEILTPRSSSFWAKWKLSTSFFTTAK